MNTTEEQMDTTERQMLLAQYLLKENYCFIDDLKEFSQDDLSILADNFLIAYFINERSFINQLLDENKKEHLGIKNHYNSFNVEHAMGYELIKKDDKITSRLNRSPFKVCDIDEDEIESITKNITSMYVEVKLNDKVIHGLPPQYKGYEIIAECKDKGRFFPEEKRSSLYDFRELYLYSKTDKAIFFKGNPPRFIHKDFKNDYTEEMISELLNDVYLNDYEELAHKKHILTLKEAINDLCDSYSHGTYKIVGEYILVKDIKSDYFIVYDKCWLKAIAETFVKIKDLSHNPKAIENSLITYFGKDRFINLQKIEDKKSIIDFLELYYSQNENFTINEGTEKFIIDNLSKMASENRININKIKDISTFLFMIEGIFHKNDCLKGIPFPSKTYLYWLDFISRASMNKRYTEIDATIKKISFELKQKKENLSKRYKKPPLDDKNFIITLTKTIKEVMDHYQSEFVQTLSFYNNNCIHKTRDLNASLSVQKEMELALILASIISPICKTYDATAIPQQHSNELFPSFTEKIKALHNDFENARWGDYGRMDLRFDDLPLEEAKRKKEMIMRQDWEEYQKASTVVKGLRGDGISSDLLAMRIFTILKVINYPKTFEYNSFWASRVISKLRNAICHSSVYLIYNPLGDQLQFLFKTTKSDREKFEYKKSKEDRLDTAFDSITDDLISEDQSCSETQTENAFSNESFFSGNDHIVYKEYYHILANPMKMFSFFNKPYFYKRIRPEKSILGLLSGNEAIKKFSFHHFSPEKKQLSFSPEKTELFIFEDGKYKPCVFEDGKNK